MISFHQQTVEVLTGAPTTDRYGNAALDWTSPSVAVVSGCRVLPVTGAEVLDRVTQRWMLFAPLGTALLATDRVRFGGVTYDVVGEVRRWSSPSGAVAHIEADLERVEG
jgi:hypothetical protein